MKKVSLSGSPRESVGKKDAKKLRNMDLVPCVLYGGERQLHFHCKQLDLKRIVFTPEVYQIELELEGKKYTSVIKDKQAHPVSGKLVHMDFLQLVPGKMVSIELPVRLNGTSVGVRAGGRLNVSFRKIGVRGLAADFPDAVEVDISTLEIGQGIKIGDIKIPGVTILVPAETQLVSVKRSRVTVEETADAAKTAAAPAVAGAEAPAAEAS